MSQHPTGPTPDETPTSRSELENDIERTRERLADSVEQLAAKTDVKAQAGAAADQAKESVRERAHQAQQNVRSGLGELVDTIRRLPPAAQAGLAAVPVLGVVLWLITARSRRNRPRPGQRR